MTLYKDKEVSEVPELQRYLIREFKGETLVEKSHNVWHELQVIVDNILDAEISRGTFVKRGIRQRIEKKMGLFRRHLMGKRVDFSARSVAAPDPMLAVDEVGVPQDFAIKLSYPVPVTSWNVPKLRRLVRIGRVFSFRASLVLGEDQKAWKGFCTLRMGSGSIYTTKVLSRPLKVRNGPDAYPGAVYIEDEEGKRINLKPDDAKQRDAIARSLLTPAESCVHRVNASKIVFRHLQDGDHVLMNRQPTLHKPSIQAHRAHIMPKDRVLRLPYANCKAYNADFDGDELNLHFPQNEMARSESLHIVNTQHQYLTPKDGSPLAGLIQDCVVASVMLTTRGVFFDLEDYEQLVYSALSHCPGKLRLLPPAILRPQRLWSGKQIISTILLNLTPEGKAPPSFKFKTTVKVDVSHPGLREGRPLSCLSQLSNIIMVPSSSMK
ncbi:UNVERIFIED_CONTAM: hypothetical protein GTU68_048031 [Idotea baltica]|nr:hypothetical protein [Idotea baltica]